jgi:hypothetical protein
MPSESAPVPFAQGAKGRSGPRFGVFGGKMRLLAKKKIRADFSMAVKSEIAKRSAFRCSFPDCDHTTTGPSESREDSLTTGIAAHIYSAQDNGPRGSGGLSFVARQSIDNAIWLCAEHASRIDKNDGIEFPASTLREYKRIHEEKIRRERDGIAAKTCWIHSLALHQAPIFRTPAEIQFGKVTVLHGDNHSGKTALCDWLQGISDPQQLCEWADPKRPGNLSFEVTYLDPAKQKLRVRVQSRDEIEYFINGEPAPFHPDPIRFVRLQYLQPNRFGNSRRRTTDLDFLSKTLSVNPVLVRNMLHYVGTQTTSTLGGLRLEQAEDDSIRVWTDVQGTMPGLSLQNQLSGTEQSRVLIEIAAVFARYSAKHVPTVLLLDWAAKSFDNRWMGRVIEFLSSDENPFQTVIERVKNGLGGHAMARVVSLEGNTADVTIGPHSSSETVSP